MYSLYDHQRYFKFKQKNQQYGPCFQTIFPFLITMENQEISVKSQKFKELYPSAQFSSENENFVNISKRLLKNRNWTFPVMPYFIWKLEFCLKYFTHECRSTRVSSRWFNLFPERILASWVVLGSFWRILRQIWVKTAKIHMSGTADCTDLVQSLF